MTSGQMRVGGAALLVALLALPLGCGRRKQTNVAPQASPAPAAVLAATVAAAPAVAAPEKQAPAEPSPSETQEVGVWAKTDVYDLRLESISRCDGNPAANAPVGGTRLLAVKIKVRSKTRSLFVAPRDASLQEAGGLLFQPVTAPKVAACRPTFKASAVRNGAEAGGSLVFEVPAQTGKLTFQFSPTRWGGSTPVRVPLPAAALAKGGVKSARVRS